MPVAEQTGYENWRLRLGVRKRCWIVGFCTSSRDIAPYDDTDTEIWGLNRGTIFMPRADRWFDMHSPQIVTSQSRRPGRHLDFLRQFKGPVFVHQRMDDLGDNQVVYPLKEIADMLGPWVWRLGKEAKDEQGRPVLLTEGLRDTTGEPYLSSSIAYEIALAIYEGFEEIGLAGIDLNTESEYAWQKPGVEFLLGVAAGRGIKVVLPDNCPLLKGTLYGRGFLSERPEVMSYEQLERRLKSLQKEQETVHVELSELVGARRELEFVQSQLVPGLDHERLDDRRKKMDDRIGQLRDKLHQVHGSLKETAYWVHQTTQGQEPSEAMQQLEKLEGERFAAEGPYTEMEILQFPENREPMSPEPQVNGAGKPDLIPVN